MNNLKVARRISRGMILNGLKNGSIKVTNDDDGLKAQIGEYWFYFGCLDGEEFDEERNDIIHNINQQAEEIKSVLDDFYDCPEIYSDEYLYYYFYLAEHQN